MYPTHFPEGDIFWELLESNFIPVPSVLARKSSLLAAGGFDAGLKLIEDWDMWLRISEVARVIALAEPVAIHRKAIAKSDQMCSNSIELCQYSLRVQDMALSRKRAQAGTNAQRRKVRQELLNRSFEILMTEATQAIHEGDATSARAKLREAFRLRPFRTIASGRIPWLMIPKREPRGL